MIGSEYAVMVFVGVMWGITNALMETSAKDFDKKTIQRSGKLSFLYDFIYLATDWRFIIPFGINQICSIGYNFVLAKVEISIATTVVNCICFIFTYISRKILHKDYKFDFRFILGTIFVITGLGICLSGKM